MDSKYQKLFKINKKSPTYGSNKITDYFSKIRETTEKKSNNSNQSSEIFPLPTDNLVDNTLNNIIQKNNIDYSQKQNLPNIQSELQDISKNESNNINMSIPEYSSHSTITSSSKNLYTIINTKISTSNKTKTKNRFDSDSTSKKSLCNNMQRTTTTKITKIQYYTINDTTASKSI